MNTIRRLRTLQWFVGAYEGAITVRQLRDAIRAGRLPATKLGRSLLVDEADVATLLAPKLRAATAKPVAMVAQSHLI